MLAPAAAPVSITPVQARELKRWFLRYAARMVRKHPRHREAMLLKLTHSIRVSRICAAIGADLGLNGTRRRLARTIGLLHDVARFEQLIRYGTFVDRVSVDHGDLGAELLCEAPLVKALTAVDRTILIHAVRHHNAATIPKESDSGVSFYLKLVRDSDKLDIYRVLCDIWLQPHGSEPASEALQLKNSPEVSPEIVAAIEARHIAPMAAVKTTADLLLVRLAWVFDLHFDPSFRQLERLGYTTRLAQALPETREINGLLKIIHGYLRVRVAAAV
jgi:hypothetical protein